MVRRLTVVLLQVMFVVCATAQQLTEGSVVVLQSTKSSGHVSALPGEGLGLSPNRAAWEQWKYYQATRKLLTVHGTVLLADYYDNTIGHKPITPRDSFFFLTKLQKIDGVEDYMGVGDVPSNGDMVAVVGSVNGVPMCLAESGGTLVFQRCSNGSLGAYTFRVYLATNPVSHPTPKEAALADLNYVKTSPGKWLQYEDTRFYVSKPGRAAHRWERPRYPVTLVNRGPYPEYPLRYGDPPVWIEARVPAGENSAGSEMTYLKNLDSGNHFVRGNRGEDDKRWHIYDPARVHKNGDRVALGENICLRLQSSTLALQADPGLLQVTLSGNCAAWEFFKLENKQ